METRKLSSDSISHERFAMPFSQASSPLSERFNPNLVRAANRDALVPILHAEIRARPRAELLEALARVGIPCGEVLGVYDALTSTRSAEGGLVRRMAHPDAGTTDVMAPPHRIDGERLPVRLAPPQFGADGEAILDDWLGGARACSL